MNSIITNFYLVISEKLINTSGSESGSTHSDTSNDSKTIRLHITHKQRRSTPDSSTAGRPIPDYGIIQTPVSSVSGKVRVATAQGKQGKQGIWFLLFPDRENTGNFVVTQGKIC